MIASIAKHVYSIKYSRRLYDTSSKFYPSGRAL